MLEAVAETPQAEHSDHETRLEQLKGTDIDFLLNECKTAISEIDTLSSKRSEANADIKAIREKLESYGIPKKSLAMALQVSKMNDDQLDGFWLAMQILLKAINRPLRADEMQIDLFADQE